jgi:hypothetical protein
MNLENLKYIHVYKFNTEQSNMIEAIKNVIIYPNNKISKILLTETSYPRN